MCEQDRSGLGRSPGTHRRGQALTTGLHPDETVLHNVDAAHAVLAPGDQKGGRASWRPPTTQPAGPTPEQDTRVHRGLQGTSCSIRPLLRFALWALGRVLLTSPAPSHPGPLTLPGRQHVLPRLTKTPASWPGGQHVGGQPWGALLASITADTHAISFR